MSNLVFNFVRLFIFIAFLATLASACSDLDYGPTTEAKCERWWEEAAAPGSRTSGDCVDLILKTCPQMLDVTLQSMSKKPLQTHVSVVREFMATHKSKRKTIAFDYKTTQELCVQVRGEVECSLWWETMSSPIVPLVKVQQCRDLYNKLCGPAAAPHNAASPPGGAGTGMDMYRRLPDWAKEFGNKVSSITKESEESDEHMEHSTMNSPSQSGNPGYFSSSQKQEHSSRKRKENTDTYHKQNGFTTDTSPGSPAAETGLHPVLASLGGSRTTVTKIEERQHRTSRSSRTEMKGYGTLPPSEHASSLGTGSLGAGSLEAVAGGRGSDSFRETGGNERTQTGMRTGYGLDQDRASFPSAKTPYEPQKNPYEPSKTTYEPQKNPYASSKTTYEPQKKPDEPSKTTYEPQKAPYEQPSMWHGPPSGGFVPPKSENDVGASTRHTAQSYNLRGLEDRTLGSSHYSAVPPSDWQTATAKPHSKNVPIQTDAAVEKLCNEWWQDAMNEYMQGKAPVHLINVIAENCPSRLQIAAHPRKTIMTDHVAVTVEKEVYDKITGQTIRVTESIREELCSDSVRDCALYWRALAHVDVAQEVKNRCAELIQRYCYKRTFIEYPGGRANDVYEAPPEVQREWREQAKLRQGQ